MQGVFLVPSISYWSKHRDGTELHMFLVRQPGNAAQRAPTLLYFHGNAGNIGHRWNIWTWSPVNKFFFQASKCERSLLCVGLQRGFVRVSRIWQERGQSQWGLLSLKIIYFQWIPFHATYCVKGPILNLSQEGLCMDAQAALDYLHTREDIASDRWLFLSLLNWCNSGFNTLKKII